MIDNYLVYITLAITVTAIPGPAVILTIRNSLKYGYKAAVANILGNFTAMVILASISAAGLGALILASEPLFRTMKILGCIYLIYLGIKTWRTSADEEHMGTVSGDAGRSVTAGAVYKQGFLVGIANPKAIAFFTALFPQFIDPSGAFIPQFLILIFTIEGISFIVLSTYAILASKASRYVNGRKPMRIFHGLSGTAFIGFGLALLFRD